jgi:hypothetical protein
VVTQAGKEDFMKIEEEISKSEEMNKYLSWER